MVKTNVPYHYLGGDKHACALKGAIYRFDTELFEDGTFCANNGAPRQTAGVPMWYKSEAEFLERWELADD